MRLTFIDSACCIFEERGYRLLCDPWLSDGAFEGSWYHYPPLKTKPQDVVDVQAIYLSHLHPDHYDPKTLAVFPRDTPILLHAAEPNFLGRLLRRDGFTRLIEVAGYETTKLGPWQVTMYPAFAKDVFHTADVGNLIDSSIVLAGEHAKIFNGNDNNPTVADARMLREQHGQFALAMLKYNAASPYPTCFMHLSDDERAAEATRILQRNMSHLAAVVAELAPTYAMPFAGSFVLAGPQAAKNACLGVTSWDIAAKHIRDALPGQETLCMREGQVFDFFDPTASKAMIDRSYTPVDIDARDAYVASELAHVRYDFDDDALDVRWLTEAVHEARANLWQAQQRFEFFRDLNLTLRVDKAWYRFNFAESGGTMMAEHSEIPTPQLTCSMNPRLLARILRREAHWNNAEIGCHIDFTRDPDEYVPDAHVLMSFFHLPA